jgi:uncharacterized protein (TIGR02646 family)
MRAITKLPEPHSLTEHRLNQSADYDNYADKDVLREQLVREQRGLCCFCCSRIVSDPLRMKIAHWMPQDVQPDSQLAYWNLLGACLGNQSRPFSDQHCDTHQANDVLTRNPANPDHRIEEIISFPPDGSITSSDEAFDREIGQRNPDGTYAEGILNLNLPFLRNNRKAALDAFQKGLNKRGELGTVQLTRLLASWRGEVEGELPPYAPVIAYWLRKRLARA